MLEFIIGFTVYCIGAQMSFQFVRDIAPLYQTVMFTLTWPIAWPICLVIVGFIDFYKEVTGRKKR